jgi:SMODS and SLOG-associating 2TM effector domain 1
VVVRKQIDTYYRPQSEAMKHRADRYRVVINVLAVVALLLGFAATVTGWQQFAAWAPVVTTVIAAVAAQGAANRYDALALEYARTYEQLERLLLERPSEAGPGSTASRRPLRCRGRGGDFRPERVVDGTQCCGGRRGGREWQTRTKYRGTTCRLVTTRTFADTTKKVTQPFGGITPQLNRPCHKARR